MTPYASHCDRFRARCCAAVSLALLVMLAAVSCGCRTIETGREARPYDVFHDPVTEVAPDVIVVHE